jgi:hypothetical protein
VVDELAAWAAPLIASRSSEVDAALSGLPAIELQNESIAACHERLI